MKFLETVDRNPPKTGKAFHVVIDVTEGDIGTKFIFWLRDGQIVQSSGPNLDDRLNRHRYAEIVTQVSAIMAPAKWRPNLRKKRAKKQTAR